MPGVAALPLFSFMHRESHHQRVNNGALRQDQCQVVSGVRSELASVQPLMAPFKIYIHRLKEIQMIGFRKIAVA